MICGINGFQTAAKQAAETYCLSLSLCLLSWLEPVPFSAVIAFSMELKLRRRQRRGQVADSVAPASHKGLTIVAIARHEIVKNTQARASRTWDCKSKFFFSEKVKVKDKRRKMANDRGKGKGQETRGKKKREYI